MKNTARTAHRHKSTPDVTLEDGWAACCDGGDFPFVGATAESERGEVFLIAYCAVQHPGPEPDGVVAVVSLLPKELDHFRRMNRPQIGAERLTVALDRRAQ